MVSTGFASLPLPSALTDFDRLAAGLGGRRAALFLDYDGTLTPIVERPELATLDDSMRDRLRALAHRGIVAVVSGRDLDDVRRLVGLDELVYAGSHGFDIVAPGGRRQVGTGYLPTLDRAGQELEDRLGGVSGLLVERKRFAIAVHTRLVAPQHKPAITEAVEAVAGRHPDLRVTGGKEVLELRPALDWDKGRAVALLAELLDLKGRGRVPLYIGDDVTDEDAFRVLRGQGIGILAAAAPGPTAAQWRLADTGEVGAFLHRIGDFV